MIETKTVQVVWYCTKGEFGLFQYCLSWAGGGGQNSPKIINNNATELVTFPKPTTQRIEPALLIPANISDFVPFV